MTALSAYRHAFGRPGEGAHRHRLVGTAAVDYGLSILLAVALTALTKVPLVLTTIAVLVVGLLAHYLFGVPTQALQYLGLLAAPATAIAGE